MNIELNGYKLLIDQVNMILIISKENIYIAQIPFKEDEKHKLKWSGPELNAVAGMSFADAVSLAASIITQSDIWHRVPERVRFKRIDVENIIRSSVSIDSGQFIIVE